MWPLSARYFQVYSTAGRVLETESLQHFGKFVEFSKSLVTDLRYFTTLNLKSVCLQLDWRCNCEASNWLASFFPQRPPSLLSYAWPLKKPSHMYFSYSKFCISQILPHVFIISFVPLLPYIPLTFWFPRSLLTLTLRILVLKKKVFFWSYCIIKILFDVFSG